MLHVTVTSSRTWRNRDLVYQALGAVIRSSADGRVKVTHGNAKSGGDHYANTWATAVPNAINDPRPADWPKYGKRAGHIRNEEMANLLPHMCLAFINPCNKPDCPDPAGHDSHGAAGMVAMSEQRETPVEIFREPLLETDDAMVALADLNDMLRGKGRHATHMQDRSGRFIYCSCGVRARAS